MIENYEIIPILVMHGFVSFFMFGLIIWTNIVQNEAYYDNA